MNYSPITITAQVAHTVRNFQQQHTGHAPKSVTVVLSDGTMVITLHEALTPEEKVLCRTDEGETQIRDFHRKLIMDSLRPLQDEIERITGSTVREVHVEVEPETGAVIHVFTTGNMLQVFKLSGGLSAEAWSGSESEPV